VKNAAGMGENLQLVVDRSVFKQFAHVPGLEPLENFVHFFDERELLKRQPAAFVFHNPGNRR
jgi:hypothetical protein